MTTLRTALREQSPSLALQRAAADEIARLDALVRGLQGAREPIGFVNVGQLLELKRGGAPYGYVYSSEGPGASTHVYVAAAGVVDERAAYEAHQLRMGWEPSDIADKCGPGAPRAGEYRNPFLQGGWEIWRARAALPAASAWQPIEAAPKNGSEIWAYNGEQGRMRWLGGWALDLWVWADDFLNDADPNPKQPTYFLPLPAAPAQEVPNA